MEKESHVSNKLHAIYAALDANNYHKALKLTQHKSISSWKITLALKCHTLRRLGRKEECIGILKNDLLSYIRYNDINGDGKTWNELLNFYLKCKRQKHGYSNEETGTYKNKDNEDSDDDEFRRLDQPLIRDVGQIQTVENIQVITDEVSEIKIKLNAVLFEITEKNR